MDFSYFYELISFLIFLSIAKSWYVPVMDCE